MAAGLVHRSSVPGAGDEKSSTKRAERAPRRFGIVLSGASLLALCFALLASSTLYSRYECAGDLDPAPEPKGWPAWPKEAGTFVGEQAGRGTLFGYSFSYDKPMGSKYPGFGNTELTDPSLCPHSRVSLDSWFTGEAWWMRHPDELSLHRDPNSDRVVVSGTGMNADGTTRPVEFVAAFRRVVSARTFVVPHPAPPVLLPLWLSALVGIATTVAGARRAITLKSARRVGVSLIIALWLVAWLVEVARQMGEAMV